MIYIHIPFCASKCAYCDFYSRPPRSGNQVTEYVDQLIREWHMRSYEVKGPVKTIYIGGGTPSLIGPSLLDKLLGVLPVSEAEEITLEANPEQITSDFIQWVEQSPVNRLSVGIQSLDDKQLSFIGRRHTAGQALAAAELIASSRISNYNLDLIYGLPGQDILSWERSLSRILDIRPTHMSCYMLTYEAGTRLDALRRARKVTPADDDTLAAMYDILCSGAARCGYEHYEISNFAQPGRRSVHNTNYWLDKPYIGLGAAAYSFDGCIRRNNPSDLTAYMAMTDSPVYDIEVESPSERHNSRIMTGLRLSDGLDMAGFAADFGLEAALRVARLSGPYIESGAMERTDNHHLRMTESGWLITDMILVDLFID